MWTADQELKELLDTKDTFQIDELRPIVERVFERIVHQEKLLNRNRKSMDKMNTRIQFAEENFKRERRIRTDYELEHRIYTNLQEAQHVNQKR